MVFFLTCRQKAKKISAYKEQFRTRLYMFDIGQNDVDAAFFSKPEDVIATIPTILLEFETGLQVFCFFSLKTEN